MVLRQNSKLMIVLLLAAVSTNTSGAPTTSNFNNDFVAATISATSNLNILDATLKNQFTEPFNYYLTSIGKEISRPPIGVTDLPPLGTKSLPPVPAAFYIVLTGFLCVSLIEDRRIWLGALNGLLWTGQAGTHAFQRLTAHIIIKHTQRKSFSDVSSLHQTEESHRLYSDIEAIQYTHHFYHLSGTPDSVMSLSVPEFLSSMSARQSNFLTSFKHVVLKRTKNNAEVSQFAITHLLSLLIHATICLVQRAEQYICFSPAFIFIRLARGPPVPAR